MKSKILAAALVFTLLISLAVPALAAENATEVVGTLTLLNNNSGVVDNYYIDNNENEMDVLDMLIAAHLYMYSSNESENIWPDEVSVKHVIPLYSADESKVAWYLELRSGEYAIINNNIANPCLLEFGSSPNPYITEILGQETEPHIIYDGPSYIYNQNETTYAVQSQGSTTSIYALYPDLEEENSYLAGLVSSCRISIEASLSGSAAPRSSYDDYGFVQWGDLPVHNFVCDGLPNIDSIDWAVYSDYDDIADNHCGAVCVTNVMMYYASVGYTQVAVNNNVDSTFAAVHEYIPNGPQMFIAPGAKSYCSSRGYTLNSSSVGSYSGFVDAIAADRPCALLLANELFDWHWVLVVGWHTYTGAECYVRIVTGWDQTSTYFYRIHDGSLAWSADQYWIS